MSERPTTETDQNAPTTQGLDLFEHYEASGALLVVTSDASTIKPEPGDFIVQRAWATAAPARRWQR